MARLTLDGVDTAPVTSCMELLRDGSRGDKSSRQLSLFFSILDGEALRGDRDREGDGRSRLGKTIPRPGVGGGEGDLI